MGDVIVDTRDIQEVMTAPRSGLAARALRAAIGEDGDERRAGGGYSGQCVALLVPAQAATLWLVGQGLESVATVRVGYPITLKGPSRRKNKA